MNVVPSSVEAVAAFGPESPEFEAALGSVLGDTPRELIDPALPFCLIVENRGDRTICFLGVRFDMTSPRNKPYSVIHYSDALRNPGKSDFRPGVCRLICAEPEYTALVLRGAPTPGTRARMNLENLRRMRRITGSVDCVAFDDGQFAGPDTQHSFERLAREREQEVAFQARVLALEGGSAADLEGMIRSAAEPSSGRAIRDFARQLVEALLTGDTQALLEAAKAHRFRIPLHR